MDIEYHCKYDELVEPHTLKRHPKNSKIHPQEQIDALCRYIRVAGWRQVVTVSKQSGFVVAGNGRQMAALAIPCLTPVVYQDFASEVDEIAYLEADNHLAELATTDEDILHANLEFLADDGFDLEMIGFDLTDLDLEANQSDGGRTERTPPPPKQDSLTPPTAEEDAILRGRKFLFEYSGGVDSSAAVLWCRTFYPDAAGELAFVDMGADYYGMHDHLRHFANASGYDIRILRSTENIIDLFYRRGEWPHGLHPYCHQLLHGALDAYNLEHDAEEVVIIRGGRASERAGNTDVRQTRFREVPRLAAYKYFEPLYFCDKTVGETELRTADWPIWPGYATGLGRTACRICPGQKQATYATIRKKYPAVWAELIELQNTLGCGAWQDPNGKFKGDFEYLARRYTERKGE